MEFPLTLTESLLACVIVLVGAILQGSVGFGLGPLSVPFLALVDPILVPGPLLVAALLLNTLIVRRERDSVKVVEIKWVIPGRVIGALLGGLVLSMIPKESLSLFWGCMILLALLLSVGGLRLKISRFSLVTTGTLSGFMATSAAAGGPPLALLFQDKDGPSLRGALSAIFFVGILLALGSLTLFGQFAWKELISSVVLFPGIVIGFLISGHTKKILDRGYVRPVMLAIIGFSAAVLIIRHFFH